MSDWSGTPDDPSGYLKMRALLGEVAEKLASLDVATAGQVREAADWVGSPTEWLGESALALKATLEVAGLPEELTRELQVLLDAIREGFNRVGDHPNF
ncbi:MAG: hypothetical protein GY701_00340 [Sulfitobacter sp.]|nr:hypothetical protein [Sulfitobacter sp.]